MGARAEERRQLKNSYIVRELEFQNEPIKQIQRDRVLAHMRRHHSKTRPRLFSLPGRHWTFEDQFLRAYPVAELIAVEKTYEIMKEGITYMPGHQRHFEYESVKTGGYVAYWTNQAKIIWCEASSIMDLDRFELMTKRREKEWAANYKRWTCAWWDFMGVIGPEVVDCLRRTENHLDPGVATCPVSITIMPAREVRETTRLMKNLVPDAEDAMELRVKFLERWLNKFNERRDVVVTDYHPYASAGGAAMLLINTLFKRKP